MDRPALAREVGERRPGAGWRFAVAGPRHDAAIRRLLRESPMHGAIALTFEREPSFFGGGIRKGERETTLVALDGERVVSMGRCLERPGYVSGEARRVAYLSELRLDPAVQGRFDLLRRGYAFARDQLLANPAELYFTSIAADNLRARRLLERGAPGLPSYTHLADLETHLIPVGRPPAHRSRSPFQLELANPAQAPELAAFLNRQNSRFDLSTVWTADRLLEEAGTGRAIDALRVVTLSGAIVACGALCDQRSFRQIVVRAYAAAVRWGRPLHNLIARAAGRPPLPPVGSVLAHAVLSPFAVSPEAEGAGPALIEALLRAARAAGLSYLTLAFDAQDPAGHALRRRFRPRVYSSCLYRVDWSGGAAPAAGRPARLVFPDAALL